MRAHRYRLPLALAAAVVAAGAATLLLRPRAGLIDPAAVEATAYFSAQELDRARDFSGPQRVIAIGGLIVSGGTLALLALRPPAPARRLVEAVSRRPIAGAAAVGASLSVVLAVVTLPLGAAAHARADEFGLSTQRWGAWVVDLLKATAIGAGMAAVGAIVAVALIRRFPRHWWAPGAVCVVALSAAFLYASPVVLDPLFNRFEALPDGRLRASVLELANGAGVDVGEVYRVDASRRTTGANAYVGGLGDTKRVVLYDNLIEGFPEDQVRSVVAHELAHVKHQDVPRGLLWLAIVAPAGMLLVQRMTEGLDRDRHATGPDAPARGSAAVLPALALSLAVVSLGGQVAGNVLSRDVEARADAFALDLTREPAAFIGLERSLATRNLSEPEPPAVTHALFGTHPTTLERIGYGLTWSRER
jgi:STE24 endopeptidase